MTYSLAATGCRADSIDQVENVAVGDEAGRLGSQQGAMRTGSQVLCRGPDGAQRYYTIDSSRSTPDAIVLLPV